jgi:hypothetical protein
VSNILKKKPELKKTVNITSGKATPAQLQAWCKFWQRVVTKANVKAKV